MNNVTLIKGVFCGLMMMSSEFALAGWEDVNTDVNITNSRAAVDRVNRVYFTYITIENTSDQVVNGPFRVLIDGSTLPVLNQEGTSTDGVPYLDLDVGQLMPGEAHKVRVNFALQRKRLSFSASLQNDVDGWDLVWSDEFDGTSIDSSKWTHEINCEGGGNQEKQCYTDSPTNSFVENGILKIVAQSESGQALPYSSARLVSKDKGDWTYGRFEVRAKAPMGQGSWPAIWMLPTDNVYGGWPNSGEVDIFESVNLKVPLDDGGIESNVYGTLHYGRNWPNNDQSGHNYLLPNGENPADDFQTYAIEWEEGEMRWYVNDVLYQTQLKSDVDVNSDGEADGLIHKGWYTESSGELLWNTAPFDERFHMILNFAVGGSWPEAVNQGGVDASAFNASNAFEIDYVRVYECSVAPGTGQGCSTVTSGYLDPIDDGGTLVNGKAPTPIPPSDGEITEIVIFENTLNPAWPPFVGADTGSYEMVLDQDAIEPDHLDVMQFTFGADPMVAGFNTNIADSPAPFDGSPLINLGVLEFDLKLVNAPNNASAPWFLKVEQGGTATAAELSIATPTLGEWQHYAIPLKTLSQAGLALNGIDVVMVFPAWGQGDGAVFNIDNVTILEGDAPPPVDPTGTEVIDFEEAPGSYTFGNFDGGVAQVVINPNLIGTNGVENTSGQVGKMEKFAGQSWGGSTITLDEAIDVPAGTVFGLNVYSERQVAVLFKLEGIVTERSEVHDGNGWQTMSFDFNSDSGSVPAVTLIFDLGTMGNASSDPANWTFYFDDMVLPGVDDGGTGGDATIDINDGIDFEGTQAAWETFENGDPSPPLEFVGNPDATGGNTSNTVAKLSLQTAAPNTGMWAGAVSRSVELFALDNSNAIVKVWVYKDKISPVGIKFERRRGDGWGAHAPRFVSNTLINQWEELTFDFTDDIGLPENEAIEGFAIYPDNVDGRAQTNVYFDNITFSANDNGGDDGGDGGTSSELVNNGGFDNGTDSWIMPGAGAISTEGDSSFFEVDVTSAGNPWDVNLSQVMTLVPNTTYEFSFKAKASVARDIIAGLGLNAAPWSNVVETVALTTQWQTFTYSLTTNGFGDDNSRVLFDLGAQVGAVFIDDVSVIEKTATDDPGGSGVATIDFESGGVGASFNWNVFENVDNPALEIVSNPAPDGVNGSTTVAKITARQGGAPWVGTETVHGQFGPMTLDASNSTVKIMVYKSVISDVGIKFAIANGGAQPEIKVSNTVVNQWEELTFDFSGNIGTFESIDISQIIVFPDFNLSGRTSDTVSYFDNISFGE